MKIHGNIEPVWPLGVLKKFTNFEKFLYHILFVSLRTILFLTNLIPHLARMISAVSLLYELLSMSFNVLKKLLTHAFYKGKENLKSGWSSTCIF